MTCMSCFDQPQLRNSFASCSTPASLAMPAVANASPTSVVQRVGAFLRRAGLGMVDLRIDAAIEPRRPFGVAPLPHPPS